MAPPPLRNPGCLKCIYCKAFFNAKKRKIALYCLQKASASVSPKNKRWRWANCENAQVKNKGGYCQEYTRLSFFLLRKYLTEKNLNSRYRMEPPVLAGDKFWKT